MSKKPESTSEGRFEIATLKKRIEQLEQQLPEAEDLKALLTRGFKCTTMQI